MNALIFWIADEEEAAADKFGGFLGTKLVPPCFAPDDAFYATLARLGVLAELVPAENLNGHALGEMALNTGDFIMNRVSELLAETN